VISKVWDDVAVTDDSLTRCVLEIRKAIGDDARRVLRTVPRRGYVLVPTSSNDDRHKVPRRPVLAVLPFGSLFDPSVQLLAAGVASDLINELGRNRDVRIIGRASSFALGSLGLPAQEIGRQLGARYLVEGTVQRTGETLIVDMQLVDASNGVIVWGDRFSTLADDIPRLQRDIATEIAASVRVSMQQTEKEATLGRAPRDLDVYALTLRGIGQHQFTAEATHACRRDLEVAVRRDPEYAPALTYLAWVNLIDIWVELTGEWHRTRLDSVIEQFTRAVELDPNLPNAFRGFGQAMILKGDVPQALDLSRRAFELGPSEPDSFMFLAVALHEAGELGEATELVERALELHPLAPSYYSYFHAMILWANEDYEGALQEADASLHKAPAIYEAEVYRTLALVGLGRVGEAKTQIAQYRARGLSTLQVPHPPALASRYLADLHTAGWRPSIASGQAAG
jgi:TolB-like protein